MIGFLRSRYVPVALALALVLAFLAGACEDDEEEATPTPPVAETPTEGATPTEEATPVVSRPGDAGIPSDPREVRGFEGILPLTLDDGLAMWMERPADEDRTGVTVDTIKLGRTAGVSGWLAAYEPFWGAPLDAIIKRVNEAGGIHGRTIELTTRDDKSDPSVTVQVTTELVDGDKVFAMFFNIGAPAHAAVHDYHVAKGVPFLFQLDSSNMGMEPVTSKWDFNGQGSDIIGGMVFAENIANQQPGAKVAVVYASDHPNSILGLAGFELAAEEKGLEIVGVFGHDLGQPDLTPQAHEVGDTDAEWVLYHGSYTESVSFMTALEQTVGWEGKVAQWGAVTGEPGVEEIMDGATMVSFQDSPELSPERPIWPALRALADDEGFFFVGGLAGLASYALEHLIRGLELAGPDLTREGLIEALESGFTLEDNWKCSTCLGPTVFGPQDHWAMEAWAMERWNNATKQYENLGILDFETSKGLGPRGNYPDLECQPPSAEFPEGTCPWEEAS
jgi:branched-chain amino acid transport system substrate-binding protein